MAEHGPDPRAELVKDCVHCGFCLPACPTYQLWGEEMDSPRGRIQLIATELDGAGMSASAAAHLDACLGCLACVPACPSGVRYDRLIELTRPLVEQQHRRGWGQRVLREALFAVFPFPGRLRVVQALLRAYQASGVSAPLRRSGLLTRLSPTLAAMEELAPPARRRVRLPTVVPARGEQRAVVGLLTGCVQSAFFSGVNAATARVLAAEGLTVVVPAHQGCCGALSAHVGRDDEARRLARRVVEVFAATEVDFVVVNVAGCGSAMKGYAELLADDPAYAAAAAGLAARTRDVAELLAEVGPVAPRHPLPVTVAYHDACHLAHGQGVRAQPRALLEAIPGLQLREIADGATCCGSAGVYNLLYPQTARELGERKAAAIRATGADLVVAANPGCLLQIAASLARVPPGSDPATRAPVPAFAHTVEVLDASIHGLSPAALGAPVRLTAPAPPPARPAAG